jgi:hypothetical protein
MEPLPMSSRMEPISIRASVKPNPMPMPSMAEASTPFFEANASARARMMQLTTMSGINRPSAS